MRILLKILSIGVAMTFSAVTTSVTAGNVGQNRWQIAEDGSINWLVDGRIPHYDHIEMSGEKVSAVLRYGVNSNGSFSLERSVVWPMLRTIPNDTHASLTRRFAHDFLAPVMVDRLTLNNEKVESIRLDGKLTVKSRFTVGHNRAMRENLRLRPCRRNYQSNLSFHYFAHVMRKIHHHQHRQERT